MSRPRVGAVSIGQAPRPDLLAPLVARAGEDVEIIEVGALDGLTIEGLPTAGGGTRSYPLTTRMRDGSRVTLDERDLAPLVQAAIDRADDAGAEATLLLCAGGFADAHARGDLVRPFDAAVSQLRGLGACRLAVVVPFEGQAEPARRKWSAAGFEVVIVVGDPKFIDVQGEAAAVDAIVLDYVGHPSRAVAAVRAAASVPVVDLGECGAEAVVPLLAARRTPAVTAGR